ncbi:hypothetical protein cyc_06466 [Cyclospora cayetanensis]|uniref:Uncharacterized protein n=1 Tax=Cyclospora cayetanensis TaxID=88456 RepID=A0A1D3CRY3_9EIME|nr:hypothetical protein cyc_06466 [Cyclospora cayetanensis]
MARRRTPRASSAADETAPADAETGETERAAAARRLLLLLTRQLPLQQPAVAVVWRAPLEDGAQLASDGHFSSVSLHLLAALSKSPTS